MCLSPAVHPGKDLTFRKAAPQHGKHPQVNPRLPQRHHSFLVDGRSTLQRMISDINLPEWVPVTLKGTVSKMQNAEKEFIPLLKAVHLLLPSLFVCCLSMFSSRLCIWMSA